ncbi:hypothetical protein [Arenibacter lacus]|uniref:hypothetical protein n=1 Tax=Arenibacter lacus TaxID=2608629 RepID=UPI000A39C74C|nr:hypothetical protein [Arenibacter lacus]
METNNLILGLLSICLSILGFIFFNNPLKPPPNRPQEDEHGLKNADRFDDKITTWRFRIALAIMFFFGVFQVVKEIFK